MKPKPTILLLSNRPAQEDLLSEPLTSGSAGYQVIRYARIGSLMESLADSDASSLDPCPCLILLDWACPDDECIAIISRLKENPDIQKVPVLVVGERSDPLVVHRCYALNASFYLLRPVDPQCLQTFVKHLGQFLTLEGIKLPLVRHSRVIDPVLNPR